MKKKNPTFGMMAAALSGVLYGGLSYFGINTVEEGCSIAQMLFWRFLLSALLLLPFVLSPKSWKGITARDFVILFIAGTFGFGFLCSYGYFLAAMRLGSGVAMVTFFTFPLGVALIGFFLYRERLSSFTVSTIALMLAGVALLGDYSDGHFDVVGIALSLLAALGYAGYIVFGKKVSISPVVGTFLICLGNALLFFMMTLWWESEPFKTDLLGFQAWVGLALVSTVLPMYLLLIAMDHISPVAGSMLSVLEPITTIFVGMFLMNETMSNIQWLGVVIVLGAAIAVQLEPMLRRGSSSRV